MNIFYVVFTFVFRKFFLDKLIATTITNATSKKKD